MLYLDINIPESGYEHIQHSINQIIKNVHAYNSENENHIAIDFPEYKHDTFNGPSIFGTKIRIFANEYTYLLNFSKSTLLRMLTKAQLIVLQDISEVPENITIGRILSRVNSQNKTLNAIPRYIKRIQKYKTDLTDSDINQIKENLKKKWSKNKPSFPFISLISKSNGHMYSLFIEFNNNVPYEWTPVNEVNSYGLSNKKHQFIIPVF